MWWKRCCKNSTGHKRYLDLSYFKLSYIFGEHKDSKGQNYSIRMIWMPKRQTPKNQCTARPQDMQLFYLDPKHFETCRFLQTFQHTQTIFAFQTDFVQIKTQNHIPQGPTAFQMFDFGLIIRSYFRSGILCLFFFPGK